MLKTLFKVRIKKMIFSTLAIASLFTPILPSTSIIADATLNDVQPRCIPGVPANRWIARYAVNVYTEGGSKVGALHSGQAVTVQRWAGTKAVIGPIYMSGGWWASLYVERAALYHAQGCD